MKEKKHYSRLMAAVSGILLLGFLAGAAAELKPFSSLGIFKNEDQKYVSIPDSGSDLASYHKNLPEGTKMPTAEDIRSAESKKAFLEAYKVFMHPRCVNCHPIGDVPMQGDKSTLHTMGVTRGIDGKGLFGNKCSNCHQLEKIEGKHMPPGNSVWHLPPMKHKMVFEGKSPRQLALSFKDTSFTGFHTLERLIEHVETDPLVRNGFTYGTRPPLTHDQFVAYVKEWIEKGAVLPDK